MKLKEIEMALDLWDSFDDEDDSNDFNLGQVKEVSGSTEAAYAENKLSTEPLLLLSAQDIKNQHEQEARTRLLARTDLYKGTIDIGSPRINPEDKLIFGGDSDINQVVPVRLNWAREAWYNGCNNNWMPQEIDMKDDIAQWKDPDYLSTRERLCITNSLGFFSTADSVVANNLVLAIYKHITNPEVRQFLLRQAFEESMHTEAYVYCAESLGLDQALTFNQYRENHSAVTAAQIANLRKRLYLTRAMQVTGIGSLLLCVVSMFLMYIQFYLISVYIFGLALVLLIISLGISVREIYISVKALELHLSDMDS